MFCVGKTWCYSGFSFWFLSFVCWWLHRFSGSCGFILIAWFRTNLTSPNTRNPATFDIFAISSLRFEYCLSCGPALCNRSYPTNHSLGQVWPRWPQFHTSLHNRNTSQRPADGNSRHQHFAPKNAFSTKQMIRNDIKEPPHILSIAFRCFYALNKRRFQGI